MLLNAWLPRPIRAALLADVAGGVPPWVEEAASIAAGKMLER